MASKRMKPPVGSRPGTLVLDPGFAPPRVRVMRYSEDLLDEQEALDVESLRAVHDSPQRWWIDVQGLGDQRTLETLAEIFSIHPLALEDVVHIPIRPKAESYDRHVLVVTRMLQLNAEAEVDSEQVSLFVGRNYVLSFQERYGDVLDPVRARLRAGNRRIRTGGADYLAYAILDTIVDAYFPVIDHMAERLEQLEDLVMTDPSSKTLHRLNRVKNALLRVRRAVSPQREAVNALIRDPSEFFGDDARLFLRDTYDHCVSTSEAVETSREFVNGLMNTYLSVISNRMNEVMKTLTIVASIFVPLTFMAGIYGMNFEFMPELGWRWAYPVLLVAMAVTVAGMLYYFSRKGWIGSGTARDNQKGRDSRDSG